MPMTRKSLLLRVSSHGDPAAWGEFVAAYQPYLLGVASRAGVPYDDAPDVVQNVFIALLRRLPQFQYDPSRGRFRAWLGRVARNAAVDWRRRRRAALPRACDGASSVVPPARESSTIPHFGDAEDERRTQFLEALDRLRRESRPQSWTCFEQHLLLGRRAADVAGELGVSANCVYVSSSRMLTRLREVCLSLSEAEHGPDDHGLPD